MKITDLAAWWGAIIATLVLLWDMYKWKRSGPIINVSVSIDMQTFGKMPNYPEGKKYVTVEVINIGDRKTTITHLVMFHYKSLFRKIRGKKDKNFFVAIPALFPPPLPHMIEPGERWLGGIEQNSELEEMSRNGYLYCGVYHSCGKKPILQRVVIHKNQDSVLET
jgi:hypothetical protein